MELAPGGECGLAFSQLKKKGRNTLNWDEAKGKLPPTFLPNKTAKGYVNYQHLLVGMSCCLHPQTR